MASGTSISFLRRTSTCCISSRSKATRGAWLPKRTASGSTGCVQFRKGRTEILPLKWYLRAGSLSAPDPRGPCASGRVARDHPVFSVKHAPRHATCLRAHVRSQSFRFPGPPLNTVPPSSWLARYFWLHLARPSIASLPPEASLDSTESATLGPCFFGGACFSFHELVCFHPQLFLLPRGTCFIYGLCRLTTLARPHLSEPRRPRRSASASFTAHTRLPAPAWSECYRPRFSDARLRRVHAQERGSTIHISAITPGDSCAAATGGLCPFRSRSPSTAWNSLPGIRSDRQKLRGAPRTEGG